MTVKFYERHPRTIVKLVTWRITMICTQTLAGFLSTGSWLTGLQIAGMVAIINTFIFWMHDRTWNRFNWGRVKDSKKQFHEKYVRTLAKSVTFRILMIFVMTTVAYLRTGSLITALKFMGTSAIFAIIAYWLHERAWTFSIARWGKKVLQG
jgi:uncharacterized membrane protein